jgi:hypothetical protein
MRLLRAGQRGAPPLNCGVRRHWIGIRMLYLGQFKVVRAPKIESFVSIREAR